MQQTTDGSLSPRQRVLAALLLSVALGTAGGLVLGASGGIVCGTLVLIALIVAKNL